MSQSNTFEGKRIKGDRDAPIYLVPDSKLRNTANPDVYEALFGTTNFTFGTVSQPMANDFAKGPALNQRTPLVKGFGDPIYLIDKQKKRWFESLDVFNQYAFSWDKITSIGLVVNLIASGPNIV